MLLLKSANTYFLVYRFKYKEAPATIVIIQVLMKKAIR